MTCKPPYIGVAYYPEDWPESELEKDVERMKQAGVNCVRIAEFAWSRLEPTEGNYQFQWLHRVVDTMGKAGIVTVMGTPTATPPAWLYYSHSDIAMEDSEGNRYSHGGRRHCCPNNKVYWNHSLDIVRRMAMEFADDPNVIGWQIDNEIYSSISHCFCPHCHKGFQDYLRKRYGSTEALNKAWNLTVFSQEYPSFDLVPMPRFTWHNPHLTQAWRTYQAEVVVNFVDAQAKVLKEYVHVPVGTDIMPLNGINYCQMFRNMDVVQFNHYNTPENLWNVCLWLDKMRNIKDRPFWNTETAPNWNGSNVILQSLKPTGYCRANSWLPIVLGGEANMYWLWRTHWGAQELMHGAVLSSSARPMVAYGEVQKFSEDMKRCAEFINDTRVTTDVAMVFPSQAWLLFGTQGIRDKFDYMETLRSKFYKPLLDECCRPDVLEAEQDISKYKVLFAPLVPNLEEADLGKRIMDWVRNGGILVTGPLTDVRNNDGARYQYSEYGMLEDFTGIRWCYEVPIAEGEVSCAWKDGTEFPVENWLELFETDDDTLATVRDAINADVVGKSILARKRIGKGTVYMLGAIPSCDAMRRIVRMAMDEAGLPCGNGDGYAVLVSPRKGTGGEGVMLVEYANKGGSYTLPKPGHDLITGEKLSRQIALAPYQVRIVKFD